MPPNEAARALYDILIKEESSRHFKSLPDPLLYPEYYEVIPSPVSLASVMQRIITQKYTLADMQKDLRRMITNARKYNRPDAPVYVDSLTLEVRSTVTGWFNCRPEQPAHAVAATAWARVDSLYCSDFPAPSVSAESYSAIYQDIGT